MEENYIIFWFINILISNILHWLLLLLLYFFKERKQWIDLKEKEISHKNLDWDTEREEKYLERKEREK